MHKLFLAPSKYWSSHTILTQGVELPRESRATATIASRTTSLTSKWPIRPFCSKTPEFNKQSSSTNSRSQTSRSRIEVSAPRFSAHRSRPRTRSCSSCPAHSNIRSARPIFSMMRVAGNRPGECRSAMRGGYRRSSTLFGRRMYSVLRSWCQKTLSVIRLRSYSALSKRAATKRPRTLLAERDTAFLELALTAASRSHA